MDLERWERIRSVFSSAIELDPGLREQYVREAARGDQDLVEKVLSLLSSDSDQTVLRSPFFTSSTGMIATSGQKMDEEPRFRERQRLPDIKDNTETLTNPVDPTVPWLHRSLPVKIGSYRLLESIGQGGMGIVYRAYDEYFQRYVALKTLQRTQAATLHRFKREFRTFANLSHPNLVSLYELLSDGRTWCFTMELVEGKTLLAHLAGDEDARLERIRNAFRQLTGAVVALHKAGKLHRDLKPSNVLVAHDNRLVVLDFGLGIDLDPAGAHETTGDHVLGTIAYMSPEQATGAPISPASDWYSIGVMLFEALTARKPFEGGLFEIIRAKATRTPVPPQALVRSIPDDLNRLCMDLLSHDPAARPTGQAVLDRLGGRFEVSLAASTNASMHRDGPFVGRTKELTALREAYQATKQGSPVVVFVRGNSGAGKTALVQHFLDEIASDSDALILKGRCYEQETVPFKALDSIVDSLVHYLRGLKSAELNAVLPRDIRALAQVFPVFWRIPAIGAAPAVRPAEITPQEIRRRAALALRELLARIGDRRVLILFLDDLHWGDTDSASLLTGLLMPPDPPVFLGIGCYRTEDAEESPFFKYLREARRGAPATHDEREITLGRLLTEEALDLAYRLLRPTGADRETMVHDVVYESAGRPFLIYELIEHLNGAAGGLEVDQPLELNDVLWHRIQRLPEESRRLLETVAIAGRPIRTVDAYRAAELGTGHQDVLGALRAARLIRGTADIHHKIEVYHDRVRQSVLAHLDDRMAQKCHRRLADVFTESTHIEPEVMAHHLSLAGQTEKAADFYAKAAAAAAEALAFDHAAALYRRALSSRNWTQDEECALLEQLANTLSNAGRGKEAAQAYLTAAANTTPAAALDLKHRAALSLLTTGHVDEGLSCLSPVLNSIGTRLARAPWRALVSLLARRLQLQLRGTGFEAHAEESVPSAVLRRIDIGWSVVIGLSIIDPIRGADFQTRSLLLALSAGEPFRVARALALEAGHLASSGSGEAAKDTLRRAEQLAAKLQRPYANGIVELAQGTVAYFDGKWNDSLTACRNAANTFHEHCTGVTWEIDTAHAFSLWSLAKMGEIGELARISPGLLKEARERGDLYAIANLSTQIMAMVRLGADDPTGARQELTEVMGAWTQNGYHVQHHDALLAFVPIELYCGDPAAAWHRVQSEWSAFRWSLLSHIQDLRIEMLQLRAYCALAMASSVPNKSPFLSAASRDSRKLHREKLPWTFALADYIDGTVAYLKGDQGAAENQLKSAIRGFDRIEAHLYSAAARVRLAQITPANSAELRLTADGWFRAQGVRFPERMVRAFAPGFPA